MHSHVQKLNLDLHVALHFTPSLETGKHKKLFTAHKVGSCPIDDNAKVIYGQTLSVLNSNHIVRNHSQMFQ